jgi:hypothetical protein
VDFAIIYHPVQVKYVGLVFSPLRVLSMGEEMTTYKTFIEIFIVVIQNIRTNFSLKICRLLVEEGFLLAGLLHKSFLLQELLYLLWLK